jgi:hypothetical protein
MYISGNINHVNTKIENVKCYLQAMGAAYGTPCFFAINPSMPA